MILDQLKEAVIKGDRSATPSLTQNAIDEGQSPATITDQALIPGMREVGKLFETGEYFIPDMLVSAKAMEAAMVVLKPLITAGDYEPVGRILMGTVAGDMHDIGKNLVSMILEGNGFEVVDMGIDVPVEKFVEKAKETRSNIVGLSALLTTTMPAMEATVKALKDSGTDVRVMVGGAPITQDFADRIGADGYADNAPHAVELALKIMGKSPPS